MDRTTLEKHLGSPGTIRALARQMAAAGCGGREPRHRTATETARVGRLTRRTQTVERRVELEPAWPVGTLSWKIDRTGKGDWLQEYKESGVTQAGDIVMMEHADLSNPHYVECRVEDQIAWRAAEGLVKLAREHDVAVTIPEPEPLPSYPSLEEIEESNRSRIEDTMRGSSPS
jgi:hypothetical protein